MKLKFITLFIIATNVLILFQDIPNNIIALIMASLIFSLFITGKKARNIFKISLLFITFGLLRYHYNTLLVTESAVSFTLILSSLKFWELDSENDHFNMFLILALCECCVFLLNPLFFIFLFGITKMFYYFYFILRIRNYDISNLNFKRLLLLVCPSLILSLLLFYTFPRFTSGFINTSDMQYLISGGNSKVNFKELGPLSLSSETAFKVYGLKEGSLPFKITYWRSAVLWQMINNEWSASSNNLKQTLSDVPEGKFKYEIELFTPFKEYMPVLDGNSYILSATQSFNSYADGSFRLKTVSRGSLNYSVVGSYGERPKNYSSLMEKKGLNLKSRRSEALRIKYFSKASNSPNDEVRLKELIQIFKNKNFEYTTNPPAYNSLEDFLSIGKSGYCSHFAAGFTYLARLYNLPARMVSGYLGGQYNPYDDSVIVKEMDAHAWVEVFIKSKGWVKIDPTVLVVPERATMSTEEFNNRLNPYITFLNFKINRDVFHFDAINNVSLWVDSLNSKFNTNIFNFDREKQLSILRSLTPGRLSVGWIFSITLIIFLGIFWLIFYFYGKGKTNPEMKRYLRFMKKMNSMGLKKAPHETISEFRLRCLSSIPSQSDYIESEVSNYLNIFYK